MLRSSPQVYNADNVLNSQLKKQHPKFTVSDHWDEQAGTGLVTLELRCGRVVEIPKVIPRIQDHTAACSGMVCSSDRDATGKEEPRCKVDAIPEVFPALSISKQGFPQCSQFLIPPCSQAALLPFSPWGCTLPAASRKNELPSLLNPSRVLWSSLQQGQVHSLFQIRVSAVWRKVSEVAPVFSTLHRYM